MAESGMKWYVLRAVSGKEAKVKEYLEACMKHDPVLAAHVGQILLPTEKYAQLRNGKRVVKEKLFLPGYVLVEANLQGEIAHTLRFMPNVLGFLGGLDNPSPVRQADINRILGTAEGGRKILLSGLTYLNPILAGEKESGDFPFEFGNNVAENLNHYYIKTIHHEFTHILNQTKDYPTSFRQVTPSSYVSDSQFSEPYVSAYLKRGFITAYAQTNTAEDFAEMVSEYVTHSPEWWEAQMKAAETKWSEDANQTQTGRILIEQKLDITRDYMRTVWNIDLDELRDCILRRQLDITSGKIDLTDLTLSSNKASN